MFPFDAILFDVGGVLLTNGWDRCERAEVLDRFHLNRDEFERRHRAPNDAWERGAITAKEYLDATVFYEQRNFSRENFLQAIFAESKLLSDGGMDILCELAQADNCLLGSLNNEAREPNEYRFQKFGLRQYLDIAFSSCLVGLRKPEPAIYRRALDILGSPPERVLFVDDRAENVAPAAAAGMKTIRFEGAAALRQELVELGAL